MRDRCNRTNNQNYARYGGRGIAVCVEWLESFVGFQRWALDNGYRDDKSIDRIDNDGSYHPGNCRWATYKMQARNKSEAKYNLMVEHDGKRLNLSEWSRATNIGYTTLVRRYKKGLRGKKLLMPTKNMQSSRLIAVREQHNGNAAITDGQVVFIRNSDETGVALAKRFKVSEAAISMIRSRQRRQDVPI